MPIIKAQLVGKQALISRSELDQLVALARRSEPVELQVLEDEVPTRDLMRLADTGRAFDFWKEDGENIYSPLDGKPV